MIAIPRQRLPRVMAGFKSEDKQLAFKVKKQFAESRNFTHRGQSNRKVCSSFVCLHLDDVMELVQFDLLCGYVYFGCTLFVNRRVGVTQGNIIYLCIYDIIVSCVEGVNRSIFILANLRKGH